MKAHHVLVVLEARFRVAREREGDEAAAWARHVHLHARETP